MEKVTAILKLIWLIAMSIIAIPLLVVGMGMVLLGAFLVGAEIDLKDIRGLK